MVRLHTKKAIRQRKNYKRRKENGKCAACKEKVKPGHSMCEKHLSKQLEYQLIKYKQIGRTMCSRCNETGHNIRRCSK